MACSIDDQIVKSQNAKSESGSTLMRDAFIKALAAKTSQKIEAAK